MPISPRRSRLVGFAATKLLAYDWPGNVRELESCIQQALAVARHEQLAVEDLPIKIREHRPDRMVLSFEVPEALVTLEELESRYIAGTTATITPSPVGA